MMIFLSPIRKKNRKMFGALAINSLLFPVFSYAALSNITIDDQYGDAVTGQTPTYVPNEIGIWAQGATCQICAAKPDVSQAFEHTWHDASQKLGETDQRSIQINFTGTAVYAFFILANQIPGVLTVTNLSFILDENQVGTFAYSPQNSTDDYLYNIPVYINTDLSNVEHQLTISTIGQPNGSLMLFDYVIYTSETNDTLSSLSSPPQETSTTSSSTPTPNSSSTVSTRSHTGAIVGGMVGGGIILITVIVLYVLNARRRRRKMNRYISVSPYVEPAVGPHMNKRGQCIDCANCGQRHMYNVVPAVSNKNTRTESKSIDKKSTNYKGASDKHNVIQVPEVALADKKRLKLAGEKQRLAEATRR